MPESGIFFRKEQCQRLFKMERGVKYRDAAKTSIIPVKNIDPNQELLKKPEWMKIKLPSSSLKIETIKNGMRRHGLHSVCEEASCPNLHECFNHGTATFMILGRFVLVVAHSVTLHMVNPYRPIRMNHVN